MSQATKAKSFGRVSGPMATLLTQIRDGRKVIMYRNHFSGKMIAFVAARRVTASALALEKKGLTRRVADERRPDHWHFELTDLATSYFEGTK